MPQGKGTYGSKVGRPPKKAKKGGKYALGWKIINPPEPIEQMMPEFDARQRSTVSPVLDEEDESDFTPVHPMFQAQMDLAGWQTMKKGGKVSDKGNKPMTENALGQIEGKVYKK